jgi:hypothetical protein
MRNVQWRRLIGKHHPESSIARSSKVKLLEEFVLNCQPASLLIPWLVLQSSLIGYLGPIEDGTEYDDMLHYLPTPSAFTVKVIIPWDSPSVNVHLIFTSSISRISISAGVHQSLEFICCSHLLLHSIVSWLCWGSVR